MHSMHSHNKAYTIRITMVSLSQSTVSRCHHKSKKRLLSNDGILISELITLLSRGEARVGMPRCFTGP
jgi:hypothetical protein